jgi:hypothetical protein
MWEYPSPPSNQQGIQYILYILCNDCSCIEEYRFANAIKALKLAWEPNKIPRTSSCLGTCYNCVDGPKPARCPKGLFEFDVSKETFAKFTAFIPNLDNTYEPGAIPLPIVQEGILKSGPSVIYIFPDDLSVGELSQRGPFIVHKCESH